MPITYDEYRKQYGSIASDPVGKAQQTFGWGDWFGASIDSAQAQLLGVGEAFGLQTGDARRSNQYEAAYARNRAIQDTGAPARISDIDGPVSLAKGAFGLFLDSAPQLGVSLAAGIAAGPVAGLSTAGRLLTAGAAGYPFNYGDVLQNQRDEAGTTRGGVAAALAVPYTAVDMLGLDALAATGKGLRVGKYLDNMTGKTGMAARVGANTGVNSLVEGGSETFQEGMNQFGRMSVNPNQTFFNDESNERYQESFLGGALLGGAVSAPMGSWRRSEQGQSRLDEAERAKAEQALQARTLESGGTADMLQPMPDMSSRLDGGLDSYGPEDGPVYRGEFEPDVQRLGQSQPGQSEMFYPNGEATYGADAGGDAPLMSSYEAATQRAGIARTRLGNKDGFDQDTPVGASIDGLDLPPKVLRTVYQQAARKADAGQHLTPFETHVLNTYTSTPNRNAQLDVAPERGQFRLDGGTTPQFDNTRPVQRPDFEHVGQDVNPAQGELDLALPETHPIVQQLADERKGQRGVTQQVPFSEVTTSPKGQVLMGLADSLFNEQHLDESAHVQVSTMIAQSKFASAKRVLDDALKEKAAADALIAKVEKLAEKEVDVQQSREGKQGVAVTVPAQTAPSNASASADPATPVVQPAAGGQSVIASERDYRADLAQLPAAIGKAGMAAVGRIERLKALITCLSGK